MGNYAALVGKRTRGILIEIANNYGDKSLYFCVDIRAAGKPP
jgi:hypothetical protein